MKGFANSSRITRLPRRIPEHVRLQQLEQLRVWVALEKGMQFARRAIGVFVHEFFPPISLMARVLRHAIAAFAPSRFRIALNSRDSARVGRFDDDVELERLQQGLAHAADVEAAVDRLLRELDGQRIVGGDASRELESALERAAQRGQHD